MADAAVLRTLARHALERQGLPLDDQTAADIDRLAGVRPSAGLPPPRTDVLTGALLSLIPPRTLGDLTPPQEALRKDRLFVELAGALRDFTLLWMRVDGKPGDREVVKLSYDAPFAARVRPWSRQAFGIAPFEVGFQAPHLGGSGSYHLAVSVPPPLRITDGALIVRESRTAEGYPDHVRPIAACTAGRQEDDRRTAEGYLSLYAHTEARDARFYVSGPRNGGSGEARIAERMRPFSDAEEDDALDPADQPG